MKLFRLLFVHCMAWGVCLSVVCSKHFFFSGDCHVFVHHKNSSFIVCVLLLVPTRTCDCLQVASTFFSSFVCRCSSLVEVAMMMMPSMMTV